MPAHDWTKVSPGIFHHFHGCWILQISNVLNENVLPKNYYALAEQVAGTVVPDIIALEQVQFNLPQIGLPESGGVAVALPPPKTAITARTENLMYAGMRKTIAVRHDPGNRVVALIEIMSRANKASRAELETFLKKAQLALKQGVNLLILDLYPPGRLDAHGIHGELWSALGQEPPTLPANKPLIAASYEASDEITAYVEPFGFGDLIPDMPLFLAPEYYVTVPLEAAYQSAFQSVPRYCREQIQCAVS